MSECEVGLVELNPLWIEFGRASWAPGGTNIHALNRWKEQPATAISYALWFRFVSGLTEVVATRA